MSTLNLRFRLTTLLFLVAIVAVLTWEFSILRPARTIEPIIDGLAAETYHEREPFIIKTRDIGKPVVPFLLKALRKHDSARVRYECANLLGEMADADVALPSLIVALKDVDPDVPKVAARVLGDFGSESKKAIPALIGVLTHRELFVRVRAAEALGQIGPDSVDAIPGLRKALKDSDGRVRVQAALALWRINREADVATSALIELLEYNRGKSYVPQEAAAALGEIGRDAETAIPALLKASAVDDGYHTRKYAVQAIQKINPEIEIAIPPLGDK